MISRNLAFAAVSAALVAFALPLEGAQPPDGWTADARISSALAQVSPSQMQSTIKKLVSFGTRSTLSAQDPESIVAGRGIGAAREWIKSEFQRYSTDCGGCLEVKVDAFTQTPTDRIKEPTPLTSVYAVLKGTDAELAKHIVLVTGHYDSRNSDNFDTKKDAPGANDDASGTAVSLECARVLSKLKFPGTIIFLTVPGEEQGLNGSKHFAHMAKQEGWIIDAVLNNDIVGGNKGPGQDTGVVRVFSEGIPNQMSDQALERIRGLGGESDSASRELARYIVESSATYDTPVKPLLIFRLDRFLRGGDHLSFNQEGFTAVRFTEFREDFTRQHQDLRTENGIAYGDTIEHVDFEYLANVARLNAATLASIACAPPSPTNVKVIATSLDNDSTLTWEAAPRATEYEVVWRATSSPLWEHAQKVGNVQKVTLQISKDNVIFAVRSLDHDGHASLPVVPTPGR